MKNQVKAIDLIENPEHLFVMFTPLNSRQDKFGLMTTCTGYNDLFCTICDLLQVATAALEYDNGENRGLAKLLEIIYDLIPMEEGNLLDILYRQYLDSNSEDEYTVNETDTKIETENP